MEARGQQRLQVDQHRDGDVREEIEREEPLPPPRSRRRHRRRRRPRPLPPPAPPANPDPTRPAPRSPLLPRAVPSPRRSPTRRLAAPQLSPLASTSRPSPAAGKPTTDFLRHSPSGRRGCSHSERLQRRIFRLVLHLGSKWGKTNFPTRTKVLPLTSQPGLGELKQRPQRVRASPGNSVGLIRPLLSTEVVQGVQADYVSIICLGSSFPRLPTPQTVLNNHT